MRGRTHKGMRTRQLFRYGGERPCCVCLKASRSSQGGGGSELAAHGILTYVFPTSSGLPSYLNSQHPFRSATYSTAYILTVKMSSMSSK